MADAAIARCSIEVEVSGVAIRPLVGAPSADWVEVGIDGNAGRPALSSSNTAIRGRQISVTLPMRNHRARRSDLATFVVLLVFLGIG